MKSKKRKKEIRIKLCNIYVQQALYPYNEVVQHPRTERPRRDRTKTASGARGPRRRKCKGPSKISQQLGSDRAYVSYIRAMLYIDALGELV